MAKRLNHISQERITMIKVSVIVPVYNKARYLKQCLDSLVVQTLKDIEIICIDDRSTDNSLNLLKEYASRDSRIKLLYHEKNQGVGASRNDGITCSSGEYIAFADADDLVEPTFYEKLYNASKDYDIVKGDIWDYDESINKCVLSPISDCNSKIKATGNPVYFFYGFSSAIFKRDLIVNNGLLFSEKYRYNEDPLFMLTVTTKGPKINVIDGAKYFYRPVENSLSRIFDNRTICDFYHSTLEMLECLRGCNLSKEDTYICIDHILSPLGAFLNKELLSYQEACEIKRSYFDLITKKHFTAASDISVSVIVPVYNGQDYLRRTLAFLTFQSLNNIEIICVNDCSTDGSLDIINEYAKDDSRIKVIDCKENGGESKARNIGIKAAKGEYIAFMDQDDKIDLLFYEKLYNTAVKNDADIAKGNAQEVFYDGNIFSVTMTPVSKHPLYFASNWWTGIFRRSMVIDNSLQLPEGYPLGGDLKFLFDAGRVANKVSTDYSVFYYHLMHEDSGDAVKTSTAKIRSVLEIKKYILDNVESEDYFHSNPDIYRFFYFNCLLHLTRRIMKCEDLEGRLLCVDFIFEHFKVCKCQEYILQRMEQGNTLLLSALKNDDRDFYKTLLSSDVLSDLFHSKAGIIKTASEKCTLVIPFIDRSCVDKYITGNSYLQEEEALTINLIDNTVENKSISVRYNEFLDNYDYSNESWIIFMHSDFEFLDHPSGILGSLDKARIYGPVGVKAYFSNGKTGFFSKGKAYEQDSENIIYENFLNKCTDQTVDTLDCMCLIVHSSLISKYHLRFDEKLSFDLYVEDFCISAGKLHYINTEALFFDCMHHSSYVTRKTYTERYLKQIDYLNKKYPDDVFGSTVVPIGGRTVSVMTDQEKTVFLLRYKLKTGKDL